MGSPPVPSTRASRLPPFSLWVAAQTVAPVSVSTRCRSTVTTGMGTAPERRFSDWVTLPRSSPWTFRALPSARTCSVLGVTGRPGTAPTILTSAACTSPGSTTSTAPVASSSVIARRVARGTGLAVDALVVERQDRHPLHEREVELRVGELRGLHRAAAGAQAQGGQQEERGRRKRGGSCLTVLEGELEAGSEVGHPEALALDVLRRRPREVGKEEELREKAIGRAEAVGRCPDTPDVVESLVRRRDRQPVAGRVGDIVALAERAPPAVVGVPPGCPSARDRGWGSRSSRPGTGSGRGGARP